jgi:rRNA processing protein Gar1
MNGNLVINKTITPFNIKGQLFKSSNSDEIVVGKLEDTLGNFKVVHFSVNGEPNKSFFVNKELKSSNKNVVKLYLILM